MKKLRLDNRQLLESYLRDVVKDAVTLVEEKDDMNLAQASQRERDRQVQTASDIKSAAPKGVKNEEEVEEAEDEEEEKKDDDKSDEKAEEKPEKKASPEPGKLGQHMHVDMPEAEDITVDMVKDRLNIIRSGQSFKDEKVAVEMNHYFESLSDPERLALLSFLTGIAQVVTAGVEGEAAPDPGDPNVDVVVKHTDGNAVREPASGEVPPKKKSSEDTSPPIAVGQRQATESIRRRIRKLMT